MFSLFRWYISQLMVSKRVDRQAHDILKGLLSIIQSGDKNISET